MNETSAEPHRREEHAAMRATSHEAQGLVPDKAPAENQYSRDSNERNATARHAFEQAKAANTAPKPRQDNVETALATKM